MKKLIHTVIVSTVALAGATQFIGCSDASPEDPPEAAQEEADSVVEAIDGFFEDLKKVA